MLAIEFEMAILRKVSQASAFFKQADYIHG